MSHWGKGNGCCVCFCSSGLPGYLVPENIRPKTDDLWSHLQICGCMCWTLGWREGQSCQLISTWWQWTSVVRRSVPVKVATSEPAGGYQWWGLEVWLKQQTGTGRPEVLQLWQSLRLKLRYGRSSGKLQIACWSYSFGKPFDESGRVSRAWGPPWQPWVDCAVALCRWCGYADLQRTGVFCSWVWSSWFESQHLEVRGYKNSRLFPLTGGELLPQVKMFKYIKVLFHERG